MKKFKCTVTRVDEYIVELDETVLNAEWMEDFRLIFFHFRDLEQHAAQIAQMRARFGKTFIEGYGIPLVNGKVPAFVNTTVNKAINIKVISEDYNCEVDVDEILDVEGSKQEAAGG